MASLWEAARAVIGDIPWSRPVPARHTKCWAQFCHAFDLFIQSPGFTSNRSPSWLYRRVHGQLPNQRIRWGDFFRTTANFSGEGLLALVTLCDSTAKCRVMCWNVRWIVDGSADRVVAKREVISRFLARGVIVCTQETHWNDTDAALWQHGLLFRQVQYCPAVPKCDLTRCPETQETQELGSAGTTGRCGGVATFLPPGFRFIEPESNTLVPGFAILSTIQTPTNDVMRIANVYLWPTAQATLWDKVRRALPSDANEDPSLLIVGDFNLDLENEEVAPPLHWMQSRPNGAFCAQEGQRGEADPEPRP